jgi:oligopeptide/dipeptide ABC transporter ATP-binding protein
MRDPEKMNSGKRTLIEDKPRKLAEIRGLTVTYEPEHGAGVVALDGISLEIRTGEVVGVMGESGSGKSTLAASMLRLLPSGTSCVGSICFENRDVLQMREEELRRLRGSSISLIPQDPAVSLNPVIRVGEQIAEVLRAHSAMTRRGRRTRVKELLHEVRFDDPERIYLAYPHQLSGGQRQRVVIAQAMACRPALLIADEPTSKLDPEVQAEILTLLSAVACTNETAMILITHDPAILAGFADRVAVMYAGRIVEEGEAEDVLQRPMHPYTQALCRLVTSGRETLAVARAPFPAIAGEPPSLTRTDAGCRFEPRCTARMQTCVNNDPKESARSDSGRVSCFLYGN